MKGKIRSILQVYFLVRKISRLTIGPFLASAGSATESSLRRKLAVL
jgi:hypothetical protein